MPNAPHRAFLSHQSADEQFVSSVATCLRGNGVDVFLDLWDIAGGDSIPSEIENGLLTCNLFVYVLSPAAVESKWVRAEYHAFLYRKLNEHGLRIIPLLRKDCALPPFIAPLKYIDFRGFDGSMASHMNPAVSGPLRDLLAAIYRTPQKPPLIAPHPSLASYELFFQPMKNPPEAHNAEFYEIGFKNITDAPLHNFTFALFFENAVESVEYDFDRSSANMTGGDGLSEDKKRFHWLGNQLADEGGWAVFIVRSKVPPIIKRISTKLLGREAGTMMLIPPDLSAAGSH